MKSLDDKSTYSREYELGGPEVLTLEEIERRTMEAIGARRYMIRFPLPILSGIVKVMERILPSPPVTNSLLELLAVSNVTTQNAIKEFVSDPRPFLPEYTSVYMRDFRISDTLARFFTR